MATIKKLIEPVYNKNKGKSATEIAKLVEEKHPGINLDSVRRTIYKHFISDKKIKNKNKIDISNNISKEDVVKYTVSNNSYFIDSTKGKISLSVEDADKMFYDFSVHGLNLTSTQMINKYHLQVWEWHSIKNALRLYKQSNIFSPHSYENFSDIEKEQIITSKISEALNDRINIEKLYNNAVVKEYKKHIKENNKKNLYQQAIISGLFDELPKIQTKELIKHRIKNLDSEMGSINVFISDLHNGSRIEDLHITENYNPEVLRKKLNFAAEQINNLNASSVTLSFLGDLIESFTGLNHLTTWKEMEYGMHGAKLVKNTIQLLLEFISKVNNVDKIIGVAGNHDRGDSNNKIDYKGEIAGIIFYWLESVLDIPVKFDFECVSENIDGIQYVVMHGHHKETTESSEKIILNYGKQGCYNLIVTGHLHTLKIKSDTHNFRHVVCPSVFTGNTYSERGGWTSTSGIMVAYNNGTNKVSLNIISI